MEQQDLLLELEQDVYLENASAGARFLNFLIDGVAIRILIYAGTIITALLMMPRVIYPNRTISISDVYGQSPYFLLLNSYLIASLVNVVYYTILEGATKGKTLGKLITGTKALQQDRSTITWKSAFLRSLCRIVPFEPFSAFGTPWHDKWTETQVVKIRR